jgi:hypothetical protein
MLMSKSRGFLLIGSLLAMTAFGAIRGPGKYNGTVIFDRWGGCHLYSGAYDMEISESVKELLRPYAGRSVLIDAKQVFQPINPGDGLITKLEVLGPAEETTSATFGHPPKLDDLSLKVLANFTAENGPELILELRNTGAVKRGVDIEALGPTLLAKKQENECLSPSDGPSVVAITRTNINFMHQYPASGGSCVIDGKGRTIRMWLPPGIVIPKTFDLDPGQSIDIPLRFELSQGEYEFLAGYGGGAHAARSLVSNRIAIDVDEKSSPKLIGPPTDGVTVPLTRRTGLICGSVVSESGSPIASAKVFLWPVPISKQELRAANHTITNQAGEFRMKNVVEGHYALSAVRIDESGVFTAATGDRHLADAPGVALPVFPPNCSIHLTLRRAATYTVRGRTMPPPADRTYTARIILKRGDAYPFEMSVPISSDGHYEFKAIPAGWYQFFAGNLGSGFEADHDIDDFDVSIDWKPLKITGSVAPEMPMSFHEAMARATLSAFHQHLQTYESQYHLGFPGSLKVLGQPPSWASPNAEHAGLVNDKFPGNEFAEDGSCISQGSYRIIYQPGAMRENGKVTGYLLSARPLEFGKTGKRSFIVDESGKVHSTDENRAAVLSDPVGARE